MLKSKIIVFAALWPVLLLLTAAQTNPTMVRPEFDTYTVEADATTTVIFVLEGAVDVYSVDVSASFDPELVEVVDANPNRVGVQVQPGQFPQPEFIAIQDVDNQAGTMRYVVTQVNPTEPANGTGVLFAVRFQGTGRTGEATMNIDLVQISNRSGELLPLLWQGAALQVKGSSGGEPVILPTGIAVQPTTVSQPVPATATHFPTPSATTQEPAPVATAAVATAAPATPDQEPLPTLPANESLPAAPTPTPVVLTAASSSDPQSTAAPIPQSNNQADSEPNPAMAAMGEVAQAVADVLVESPQPSSPEEGKPDEALTVIGENVTLNTSPETNSNGVDGNSSTTIGVVIAIIVALVGTGLLILLARRSH